MYKICYECKVEKPVSEFNIKTSNKDGYNNKCAECMREYQRERAKHKVKQPVEVSKGFKLNKPGIEEYERMYGFLISAGYDVSKDIHIQFCEKYNLVPKPRGIKDRNQFTYEDCFKTGE
jgi:hypothetical protein